MQAKRILVIDDAFERMVPELRDRGFEVIETGPSTSALQGASIINAHQDEADVILLDMQLGEENDAGAKIAGLLPPEAKGKVIGVTGETVAKQLFKSLGIAHTPGKRIADILGCIQGNCKCAKKAKQPLQSKCDILIVWDSDPFIKALKRVLGTLIGDRFHIESCGVGKNELISALREWRPKVVLYTIASDKEWRTFFNPMRGAEHEYSQLLLADDSLPDFNDLYGQAIMVANPPWEAKAEEAEALGHLFLKQPLQVPELVSILMRLLGEDQLKEWEIRSRPLFQHKERDELIDIARTMSPTSSKQAALDLLGDDPNAEKVAKACRWLAKIRKTFGREKFEQVVSRNLT